MSPHSFVPVILSRAEAEAANTLFGAYRACGPWRIVLADKAFQLDLLPRPQSFRPRVTLNLELGSIPVWIDLGQDILSDTLAGFMAPGDGASLPSTLRTALLEAVCEEALAGLSALLGQPLTLVGLQENSPDQPDRPSDDLSDHPAGHPCLGLTLTRLDDGWRTFGVARVRAGEQAADLFGLLVRAAGTIQNPPGFNQDQAMDPTLTDLPIVLRPTIGRTWVSVAELRDLAVNDLVLVEEFFGEHAPRLHLGPNMALAARVRDNVAIITSILTESDMQTQPESDPASQEATLSSPAETKTEQSPSSLDLDALDIELRFELGRETLTLGELRNLAPGRTFELKSSIQAPVTVTANARPVARGELVDIEGRAGVRILELLAGQQAEPDV